MTIKQFLISVTVFGSIFPLNNNVYAQYYYNDILTTIDENKKIAIYSQQKITNITTSNYNAAGRKNTSFNEITNIDHSSRLITTTTINNQTVSKSSISFDENGRMKTITDTDMPVIVTTTYSYLPSGLLNTVKIITEETNDKINTTEERQWSYTAAGIPEKVVVWINGEQNSESRFKTDSVYNVIEEVLYRNNRPYSTIEYYYDATNRLTDVVRFDKKLNMAIADFMLEYNKESFITKKTIILSAARRDYNVWQYEYNDIGLKITEALLNKFKEPVISFRHLYK